MSKRTILKGALFLTITGFATRFLGFYNRIFLTRLIGVNQLGIYQLIFPIYILSYAISSQGIALSLTKNISFYSGKSNNLACRIVFRKSIILSLITSITCSILLFSLASFLSSFFLHNEACSILLKTISIAIPFVAIKSCFNAFFVGLNQPFLQGTSHFYEQIVRISVTYLLFKLLKNNFTGARIAIIAVVIGEIWACMYSSVYYLFKRRKYINYDKFNSISLDQKTINNQLIKDALPLSFNNIILTLFATIEAMLLPAMLFKYYHNQDMALDMYGIMSGIVMPFILFPSTITNSISTMLMPSVSYAVAANDNNKIKKARNNTIAFCSALGIIAWIFFLLFGKPVCNITFKNNIAGEILSTVGFLCPLLYLASTQSAILNGMGKTYKNLIVSVLTTAIRIIVIANYVPKFGIAAYIFSMVLSYAIQNVLLILFTAFLTADNNEA